MVSLGQKLKMPKTCEKDISVLCKKRLQKANIWEIDQKIGKNGHNAKAIAFEIVKN